MCQAVQPHCPICKKAVDMKFRPFCSSRCANIDLGSWLTERYTVPTSESPDDIASANDESASE